MARLFFLENLAVGAVALVLGVVLGNLMFQILRAIMLALFGVEYRLSFAFSLEAVGMTAALRAACLPAGPGPEQETHPQDADSRLHGTGPSE